MRKLLLLLMLICVALGGCGGVEWFPEQGVSQFSFSPDTVTDAGAGETVTSNTITVSTRNASETITVSGGEYSIGGGEFTSDSGTVQNGDQVAVRHPASNEGGGKVVTTLRIGDKSASFTSITAVPLVFDTPLVLNAAPATQQTSSQETVEIANGSAPISITGGSYSIDDGAFVTTPSTINNGQKVRVRHQSATAGTTGAAATKVTELTIGKTKSTFASSVTGVATIALTATGAPSVPVTVEAVSLVSGTQTISVQEGFGQFSVDGETFFDQAEPQTVTLRPGQTLYFLDVQTGDGTTTYKIGNSQIVTLQVTRK